MFALPYHMRKWYRCLWNNARITAIKLYRKHTKWIKQRLLKPCEKISYKSNIGLSKFARKKQRIIINQKVKTNYHKISINLFVKRLSVLSLAEIVKRQKQRAGIQQQSFLALEFTTRKVIGRITHAERNNQCKVFIQYRKIPVINACNLH